MDDCATVELKVIGETNGDTAYLLKLQGTKDESSGFCTPPGVETSSSISETSIASRKDSDYEIYDNKDKNKDRNHVGSSVKCTASDGEQITDIRDSNDTRRKFRVLGLTFPGKWMTSEKFLSLLEKSESFHIWFDEHTKGGIKQGGLSAVYGTPEEAKLAFSAFHKMTFDGSSLKLQASKLFYEPLPNTRQPPIPFKADPSHPDCPRRLYALHLTSATDQALISSIFGSDCIETVQLELDPFIPSEKQAEIVFKSKEEANDAKEELADGFEIDEGDRQLTMRLLTTNEYVSYMKAEYDKIISARVTPVNISSSLSLSNTSILSPSASSTVIASASSSEATITPFVLAPEITVEDVTDFMQQYIDDTRTNWAELNEQSDLWKLCDEVSQRHNGIPDCLLKLALLNVLEQHQRSDTTHWMRRHVDELIRIWKKEMKLAKGAQRSTSYTLCSATYIPYVDRDKKKITKISIEKKRALTAMMGVGTVLDKVRTMLSTEDGELEVDEDEYGNYSIDGQPLSFELWAEVNKQGAAVSEEQSQSVANSNNEKLRDEWNKEAEKKKVDKEIAKKMLVMDKETGNVKDVKSNSEVEAQVITPEVSKELEEGEMSSESSSSTASTSSNESNNEGTAPRHRRRKRRRRENYSQLNSVQAVMGSVNPQFTTLFAQLYEQRHAVCHLLSPSHKSAFASVLGQTISSPQGMTSAQQNQMNLFIQNFAPHSMPK